MKTSSWLGLGLITTWASLSLIPLSADPEWWSDGNPPVIEPGAPENHRGPANIGQAKWMVSEALRALGEVDPVAAGEIEDRLTQAQPHPTQPNVTLPPILSLELPPPAERDQAWKDKQRAPLLIGQLKAISAPFYEVLHTRHPVWLAAQRTANQTQDSANPQNIYPWTATPTDDENRAIANIGQLKAVFALNFEDIEEGPLDSDGDGLPDEWEIAHGLDPNTSGDQNNSFQGGATTNGQAFNSGVQADPNASLVDKDGDGVKDEYDAVPADKRIDWEKSPHPRFVMIPLRKLSATEITSPVYPTGLNNNGRMVGWTSNGVSGQLLYFNGQNWINIPEPNLSTIGGEGGHSYQAVSLQNGGWTKIDDAGYAYAEVKFTSEHENAYPLSITRICSYRPDKGIELVPLDSSGDLVPHVAGGVDSLGYRLTSYSGTGGSVVIKSGNVSESFIYEPGANPVALNSVDSKSRFTLFRPSTQKSELWELSGGGFSQTLVTSHTLYDSVDVSPGPGARVNPQSMRTVAVGSGAMFVRTTEGQSYEEVSVDSFSVGSNPWHGLNVSKQGWVLGNHAGAGAIGIWCNGSVLAWKEVVVNLGPGDGISLIQQMNEEGMCVGTAVVDGLYQGIVLIPVEVVIHRRGSIAAPGPAIPRPTDQNAIYESVTLENADYDETSWRPSSMADAARANNQDGVTEEINRLNDDDFVKLHLESPIPRMQGSIELVMENPGQGNRLRADDLRFYNSDGDRIQLADLRISDLQNPQGPLAPMLQENGLDLFIEVADLGQLTLDDGEANRNLRRCADLILRLNLNGQVNEYRVRIYRGGYWRNQRNGNTGTIAFYDGKGRYQDQNGAWQIDVGNLVHGPFNIQSGTGTTDETVEDRGPTPVGWYGLFERIDFRTRWRGRSRPQTDHTIGRNGQQLGYLQQGSYCQWSGPGNRTAYTHQGANPPSSVRFKFELVPWGHDAHGRTFLQIHPDGFNDGTAGCIGLQAYNDCCRVFFLLRHYFGTQLNVETP